MSARAHILKPYDCCRLKNSSSACTRKWDPRRQWNLNSSRTYRARNTRAVAIRYDDSFSSKCSIISRTTVAEGKRYATVSSRYFITSRQWTDRFLYFQFFTYDGIFIAHFATSRKYSHVYRMSFPMVINTWILYSNMTHHFNETISSCVNVQRG